ncbi:MAG: HpaII family restriction endonuclease [Bacillota bacterium]
MITGNKGEWSEIYTFFKLLGEGELYSADENLNKIENIYYPILKIFREADNRNYELNDVVKVIDSDKREVVREISVSDFLDQSEILLNKIKSASGRSFSFPDIEEFMESIDCNSLKSKADNKRDITIKIHDKFTNTNPKLGFSIKSRLGGKSTLFNSNRDKTNFLYKLKGYKFNEEEIEDINSMKYNKSKIKEIEKYCEISYHDMCDKNFKSNLQVIDSRLPEIIAHMVYKYYKTSLSKISDLTSDLRIENPCDYESEDHNFYKYKIKSFLIDVALGMTASSIWDGEFDATGGYIIVREDGEVLCYHLYNYNEFKSYLYENTKLDSPSSTRHDYGDVFKKEDEFFIKFNLQVRFK